MEIKKLAKKITALVLAAQAAVFLCFSLGNVYASEEVQADIYSVDSLSDAEKAANLLSDTGMATTGNAYVLGLRVDFPDMTFEESDTEDALNSIINAPADSTSANFPYESLNAYYQRASYGRLSISGETRSYTAQYERGYYASARDVVLEALNALDSQLDYTKFDANSDGCIDAVYMHFAGPDTGWDTTWWSVCNTDYASYFDGVELRSYVTLQYDSSTYQGRTTIIHETGHVLGLPDLYAYDTDTSSSGTTGTCTWEMMDNEVGDINGFFKWLLGWIDDANITRVVANDSGITVTKAGQTLQQVASGTVDVSLEAFDWDDISKNGGFIVVSNADEGMVANYFLIQYEQFAGNQSVYYCTDYTEQGIKTEKIPSGFRIYNVNSELSRQGGWMHSNTSGISNEQLIRALDFDSEGFHMVLGENTVPKNQDSSTYGCMPGVGVVTDYSTNPSTNYMEKQTIGFTGLTFEVVSAEKSTGTIRIGYSPEGKIDLSQFSLTDNSTYGVINNIAINLTAPWDVEKNTMSDAKAILYVGDVAQEIDVTVDRTSITGSCFLNPGDLLPTDSCALVFGAGYFKIGSENGQDVYSQEITVPIKVKQMADIVARDTLYCIETEDSNIAVSNTVPIGEDVYFVWADYNGIYLSGVNMNDMYAAFSLPLEGLGFTLSSLMDYSQMKLFNVSSEKLLLQAKTSEGFYFYWIDKNSAAIVGSYAIPDVNLSFKISGDMVYYTEDSSSVRAFHLADTGEVEALTGVLEYGYDIWSVYPWTNPESGACGVTISMPAGEQVDSLRLVSFDNSTIIERLRDGYISEEAITGALQDVSISIDVDSSIQDLICKNDAVYMLGYEMVQDEATQTWNPQYIIRQYGITDEGGVLNVSGEIYVEPLSNLRSYDIKDMEINGNYLMCQAVSNDDIYFINSEAICIKLEDIGKYKTTSACGDSIGSNIYGKGCFTDTSHWLTLSEFIDEDYALRLSACISNLDKITAAGSVAEPETTSETKSAENEPAAETTAGISDALIFAIITAVCLAGLAFTIFILKKKKKI